MDPRVVTLSNLADGAAEELWQAALQQVLDNVDDPNTDCRTKRRITLTFTIATDENRRAGDVQIACATKLAGVKAVGTRIFIGRHEGELAAVEAYRQEEMFPTPTGRPVAVEGGAQ